jgi:membrane protein
MPETSAMDSPPNTPAAKPGRVDLLHQALADARRFVADDLWDRDVTAMPRRQQLLFSLGRICAIVVRGFMADNCALHASALTYISLMSMIPVLAMMFSFSKGIGMQNRLIEAIGLERVETVETVNGKEVTRVQFLIAARPGNRPGTPAANGSTQFTLDSLPEPLQKVVTTVFSYVENTSFGALGLVGSLLLLWGAIQAMSQLEQSFNAIWGVKVPRPLFRRFTEYFFVLVLIPVLFLVATSVNAGLSAPAVIARIDAWFGPLARLYALTLRLFGVAVVVGAFAFLFKFMPNTDVKTLPAVAGGVVGGALWYATQWVYITFQIGLTSYNAIYGTFAAVPFFLAWLYANWTIVLFGAEVAFAVQNYRTYILEGSAVAASPAARVMLGVALTYEACKAYIAGERGWRPAAFARAHTVPVRLVASVAATLVAHGILVPVDLGGDRDRCYVPGKPPDLLTLADIELAVRAGNRQYTTPLMALVPECVGAGMRRTYDAFVQQLGAVSFRRLVEQAQDGSSAPATRP